MKIIYLHQYFTTPDMSGGTRSYEMAKRMVQAGHEVHMVTSRVDNALEESGWMQQQINGINIHWLPVRYDNSMGYARRIAAFFSFALRAGRYAATLDGDVVFATSTPLTIAIPARHVSRKCKAPMVFEVRDLWPEIPIAIGALNYPFAKSLARYLEKWAYRHSVRVVGLSPGMCQGVVRAGYPAEKTICIPNSADVELFNVPDTVGHRFRKQRDWLGTRKLVVYAGTFGRINGVGYLADMAAAMERIDPEIRFLAVGKGLEFESVKQRAQELGVLEKNFFLEGPIPKTQMPVLFNAATICTSLVVPLESLWNNSANKFFDALAAGRPVMINHGGWQKSLLESHDAGLSVPFNDPQAAAERLYEFLESDERLAHAGSNAFRLATQEFSRDKLAGKLITVLEEVVAESHG